MVGPHPPPKVRFCFIFVPIYSWKEHTPLLGKNVWVAPDAQVIGQVALGEDSSVWFSCLVRGDVHKISIGKGTNIQDHSVLHVTQGKFPLEIGDFCTLGHRVTVHGCTLKDYVFIGMGATVLDGCELGEFSLLGAGSLLTPGKKIPPRMLAMGSPAKVIREITEKEENMIRAIPEKYRLLKDDYCLEKNFKKIK